MTIINNTLLGDNIYGTIASGLAVGDTALTFTTGHGARFPTITSGQVLYCCLLNAGNVLEEIKITAHAAGVDSATIARGQGGTTAKVWSAGDRIEARLSSTVLQAISSAGINIVANGADPTGVADSLAAIVASISAGLAAGLPVFVPAGTFSYSSTFTLNGVVMYGTGNNSILAASDPNNSAVILTGTGPALRLVKTTSPNAVARDSSNTTNGVYVNGAAKFSVENVFVTGCEGAGILVDAGTKGVILNNRVESTLSDGIHITDTSLDILVKGNIVDASQDDCIAVVSYQSQTNPCKRISIVGNQVRNGTARGISVVGGEDVEIGVNHVYNSFAAGIYVAQETAFSTLAPKKINVVGNHVTGCATGSTNAPIHVTSGDASYKAYDIDVRSNKIVGNGATSTYGIAVSANTQFVTVEGNSIRDLTNGSAIYVDGEDTVVKDNQMGTIPQAGITIDTDCLGKLIVSGNRGDNLNTSNSASMRGINVGSTPTSLTQLIANDNHFTDGANALAAGIFINALGPQQYQQRGNTWNGVLLPEFDAVEKSTNDFQINLNNKRLTFSNVAQAELAVSGSSSQTFSVVLQGLRHTPIRYRLLVVRNADPNQWAVIDEIWKYTAAAGTGSSGTDFLALTGGTNKFQRCNLAGAGGANVVSNGTWGTIGITADGSDNVTVTFTPPAATVINAFCRVEYTRRTG